MASPEEELQRKLAALKTQFVERLPARLEAMGKALQALEVADPGQATAALKSLRNEAHKLSGTAGTFGFEALGEAASALEAFCDRLIDAGKATGAEDRRAIGTHLAALRKAAAV